MVTTTIITVDQYESNVYVDHSHHLHHVYTLLLLHTLHPRYSTFKDGNQQQRDERKT